MPRGNRGMQLVKFMASSVANAMSEDYQMILLYTNSAFVQLLSAVSVVCCSSIVDYGKEPIWTFNRSS